MTSDLHQRYAEEVAALSGVKSPALLQALASVHREDFLPPGPWLIESMEGVFYASDDADPRHVLHGVSIALDATSRMRPAGCMAMVSVCR